MSDREKLSRPDDSRLAAYTHEWARRQESAFLLVRPELSVLWLNEAADSLISADPGVNIVSGRLMLNGKAGQEELVARMDMVLSSAAPIAWATRTGVDNHLLVFSAARLAPDGNEPLIGTSMRSARPGGQTWVNIANIFHMTPSEMRVLNALLAGRTAEQLAVDLGITIETSRTHIKRIYNKLDVSSREGLFAKLMPFQTP